MVAASILPISIHNGKIYFLFGKENEMEDSSKGVSDFGGAVEKGESIIDTALREGSEELCGFLGEPKQIKQLIKSNGGVYKISHNDYHVHLFYMDYDEKLPHYFTNHHRFLWDRMNKKMLNNSKYFEKQEIKWFSTEEMRTSQEKFRHFYVEIVNKLLSHIKKITDFANKMKITKNSSRSLSRKTRKYKGG